MATFLSLPVELLQRVAGYLPCSAALRLARVNRDLHNACYDRLVFKYIALNAVYHSDLHVQFADLPTCRQESLDWAEGREYLENATFEETARTAYAVEQLLKAALTTEESSSATRESVTLDSNQWLPHLLALRHPACQLIRAEPLLQTYYHLAQNYTTSTASNDPPADDDGSSNRHQDTEMTTAAFSLIYTILLQIGNSFLYSGVVNAKPKHVSRALARTIHSVLPSDFGPGHYAIQYRRTVVRFLEQRSALDPEFGTFPLNITLRHAYTWMLPLVLAITLRWQDRPDQFPYPMHMPFHTMMNIPRVYQDTAALFNTCHLDKMTTPEALSGMWLGYYSDVRGGLMEVDPPMWYIQMRARPRGPNDRPSPRIKAILDRSTNGADAHGPFTFYGEVSDDGKVDFAKLYTTQGWSWMYRGVITPFGIVGAWGSFGEQLGGHFWIWNKDWR